MDIEQIIRIPDPLTKVKVELREVVHEVAGKPHIFLRVRINDWYFPERAPEPFLVIGLIASIRRMLVISLEMAALTKQGAWSNEAASLFRAP